MGRIKAKTVDAYISEFPKSIQRILSELRATIKEAVPDSEETISYAMPAYKFKGQILVYFAGYEKHIGFYATPSGHSAFEKELSNYKQGKGSVQFPIDEPLPLKLITRIVKFRAKEASQNIKAKKKSAR